MSDKLDEIEKDVRFFSEVQMRDHEERSLFEHCFWLIDRVRKLEKVAEAARVGAFHHSSCLWLG